MLAWVLTGLDQNSRQEPLKMPKGLRWETLYDTNLQYYYNTTPRTDEQKTGFNFTFLGQRFFFEVVPFAKYPRSGWQMAGEKRGLFQIRVCVWSGVHTSRLCPPLRFNRAPRKNLKSLPRLFDIWTPTSHRLRRKTTKGDDEEVGRGRDVCKSLESIYKPVGATLRLQVQYVRNISLPFYPPSYYLEVAAEAETDTKEKHLSLHNHK